MYIHRVRYSAEINIMHAGLSSISVHKRGALVAIGDDKGTVSLLEVSDSLSRPNPNEKLAMSSMFERETQREKNLILLAKEQQRREVQAAKEKKRLVHVLISFFPPGCALTASTLR